MTEIQIRACLAGFYESARSCCEITEFSVFLKVECSKHRKICCEITELSFKLLRNCWILREFSINTYNFVKKMFFAAIWSDLRCKCRKCSKIGAFLGLWAENAPKWLPRDKKWAFWVFEVSALILENSSLELKMLENQLFAAIWSDFRCKCRKC